MLGMMVSPGAAGRLPFAPNAWSLWLDYLMEEKRSLALSCAVLLYSNGTAASSRKLSVSQQDFRALKRCLSNSGGTTETISVAGTTYCIKSATDRQLVAFNGHRYLIVSRSMRLYVVAMCQSRAKCDRAARRVASLAAKLTAKDY